MSSHDKRLDRVIVCLYVLRKVIQARHGPHHTAQESTQLSIFLRVQRDVLARESPRNQLHLTR